MERCSPAERELIRAAIEEGGADRLDDIVAIVSRPGALQITHERAAQEARRAIAALTSLPDGVHRRALNDLAAQLLQRRA